MTQTLGSSMNQQVTIKVILLPFTIYSICGNDTGDRRVQVDSFFIKFMLININRTSNMQWVTVFFLTYSKESSMLDLAEVTCCGGVSGSYK